MKKEKAKNRSSLKDARPQIQQLAGPIKKNKYGDLIGLASIIVLGILIYSNSFNCSFHFDDSFNIVDNTAIRDLSDVKAWWNYNPRRSVAFFTFALNYHFNQLDVWYWHLVNLVIHLINAGLVWWLTLLIFSSPVLKDSPLAKHNKSIALLTGLLFVSHPLATQSVTYIVQRMASMVTMFYLLSLALYVKARLKSNRSLSTYLLYAGSLASAMLAFLTKENAFTLPIAIVLFEIFFIQTKRFSLNLKDSRTLLIIGAFLGVLIIGFLRFSMGIFKPIPPSLGATYTITSFNYLFTQFSVILKYIQLLFLPINQNFDYDFPISNSFFEIRALFSFMLLLAIITCGVWLFNKNRVISFGIFWFFLTLSIESSIIPINDVIYEHRTYLPSFGFFLIVSTGIFALLWNRFKYFAISVCLLIIGINANLTYQRNKVWRDDLSLWNDVVSKSPNKARPIASRGDYYRDMKQWNNAIADYSEALRINPKYSTAYQNRGNIYGKTGQWNKAITDYSNAISVDPKYKIALYNRGLAYGSLRQWNEAIADYSKAIEIDQKYVDAYNNRGIAYGELGLREKAIADYTEAIRLDPKYVAVYSNRAISYVELEQMDLAIADYNKAIEINPKSTQTYYNLGVAYIKLKQWDKAIEKFTKAIELDPKNANAYSNRGLAYGNKGQWDKAIAEYSKAIELDPNSKAAYSNREIAYKKRLPIKK